MYKLLIWQKALSNKATKNTEAFALGQFYNINIDHGEKKYIQIKNTVSNDFNKKKMLIYLLSLGASPVQSTGMHSRHFRLCTLSLQSKNK